MQNRLSIVSKNSKLINYDNFHITLCYIGEVNLACKNKIVKVLDNIKHNHKEFFIELDNFSNVGVFIEIRPYKPHVTLGKNIRIKNNHGLMETPMRIKVLKVELMLLERVMGQVIYSSLYSICLK